MPRGGGLCLVWRSYRRYRAVVCRVGRASIAAAHVTGFAALLLAHYPLFRGAYVARGEQRVAALFETIRASGDPSRVGGGLADLLRIPGWAFLVQQPGRGDALPQLPEALRAAAFCGRDTATGFEPPSDATPRDGYDLSSGSLHGCRVPERAE